MDEDIWEAVLDAGKDFWQAVLDSGDDIWAGSFGFRRGYLAGSFRCRRGYLAGQARIFGGQFRHWRVRTFAWQSYMLCPHICSPLRGKVGGGRSGELSDGSLEIL